MQEAMVSPRTRAVATSRNNESRRRGERGGAALDACPAAGGDGVSRPEQVLSSYEGRGEGVKGQCQEAPGSPKHR